MKFRKKQVKFIWGCETKTLEEEINEELQKFDIPDDIIDIKFSVKVAMIIYWVD